MHWALRFEKIYQYVHDAGPLGFLFLQPRGTLTNPFRTLSFSSGSQAINQVTYPRMYIFLFLSASGITIISWQDVTRPSLCTCVKECGTQRAHNSFFPKSSFRIRRTANFEIYKDYYHSWWDSTVIFDKISNSGNVYHSSNESGKATSLVFFYQLPSDFKSRIPPKNVWSVQSLIPISLLRQY